MISGLASLASSIGTYVTPSRMSRPATLSDICNVENRTGQTLPDDYREFLLCTNGAQIAGLVFLSADEIVSESEELVPFQSWGNGDFDCIRYTKSGAVQDIVFMNHNPDVCVGIAPSFLAWFDRIIEEVSKSRSDILHPGDYRGMQTRVGTYAHVLDALRGVDCELND